MGNKRNDLAKAMSNQKQRFGIRKFSVGAVSVLLGTTFLFGVNQEVVHAEVQSSSNDAITKTEDVKPAEQKIETGNAEVAHAEAQPASDSAKNKDVNEFDTTDPVEKDEVTTGQNDNASVATGVNRNDDEIKNSEETTELKVKNAQHMMPDEAVRASLASESDKESLHVKLHDDATRGIDSGEWTHLSDSDQNTGEVPINPFDNEWLALDETGNNVKKLPDAYVVYGQKQTQTTTYQFFDKATAALVGSPVTITGKVGETVKLNYTIPDNYELVAGQPTEYTFVAGYNQPVYVYIEHKIKDITQDPGNYVTDVEREYKFISNTPHKDPETFKTLHVHLTRTVGIDLVTNKPVYGDWQITPDTEKDTMFIANGEVFDCPIDVPGYTSAWEDPSKELWRRIPLIVQLIIH